MLKLRQALPLLPRLPLAAALLAAGAVQAAPGYELVRGWRAMNDYSYSANCLAEAVLTAARPLGAASARIPTAPRRCSTG